MALESLLMTLGLRIFFLERMIDSCISKALLRMFVRVILMNIPLIKGSKGFNLKRATKRRTSGGNKLIKNERKHGYCQIYILFSILLVVLLFSSLSSQHAYVSLNHLHSSYPVQVF